MAKEIEYNYMAVKDADGEVVGIFAMEIGSLNEKIIVEKAIEFGVSIEKSTEKDFKEFGEEEIQIST